MALNSLAENTTYFDTLEWLIGNMQALLSNLPAPSVSEETNNMALLNSLTSKYIAKSHEIVTQVIWLIHLWGHLDFGVDWFRMPTEAGCNGFISIVFHVISYLNKSLLVSKIQPQMTKKRNGSSIYTSLPMYPSKYRLFFF